MKWLALIAFLVLLACRVESSDGAPEPKVLAPGVLHVGNIQHPRITESSGVVVSRRNPDILWTHNDGGGKRQVLYAMTRDGKPVAEFRITGAAIEDWEDIAADEQGHLFVGDIGNNEARPLTIAVHEIDEPDIKATQNGLARATRSWRLRYPGKPFDCEALFVWKEHGYLVSKVFDNERADIYRFALTNTAAFQTLEPVVEVRIDSPVTGATMSNDGALLALVAKNGAYVFRINGDVTRAGKGKPFHVKYKDGQIEACTFVPEGLLTTTESREIFLFTDEAFRSGPAKKK